MAKQFEWAALIEQAQRALESCQPTLAIKFIERAIETWHATKSSTTTTSTTDAETEANLHRLLGWAYMETITTAPHMTETETMHATTSARTAYLSTIRLAPSECSDNIETFLHLGQLSVGKGAIGFYEQGVKLLMNEVEAGLNGVHDDQVLLLKRKIGSALCSMTEIYMTDCCDEPEAESKCEEYMSLAQTEDPQNPEVHQTLASVRLSQSRPDEARVSLQHSMDLWYTETQDNGEDVTEMPTVPDPKWPAQPVRIALAKLLMEVSLHERALAVLQTCLVDDDEDPDTWYLYGWCYWQMAQLMDQQGDTETRSLFVDDARECFQSVLRIEEKANGSVEPPMLEHIAELMGQLGA